MTDDSASWIAAARTGDARAFGRLVEACQAGVRAFLAVRLSDRHAADDLAQNAFIIAYQRLDDFREGESFPAWVRGIAHNLLRNHLKRRQERASSQDVRAIGILDDQAERMAERHDAEQLAQALRACLAKLPDDQRRLVTARYVDERPIEELCRTAGCKHSAMTMLLHRVRLRLRACMSGSAAEASP